MTSSPEQTLGYSLNNWLNIRLSPDNWNGQLRPGGRAGMAEFSHPAYSLRAAKIIYSGYQTSPTHSIISPWVSLRFPQATRRSTAHLIHTFAPPEGPNDTLAYITHFAQWGGFTPTYEPDFTSPDTTMDFLTCGIRQEIGLPANLREVLATARQLIFPSVTQTT